MFRSAYRYLKFKLEDGMHVVARGRLSVYEPKGEYQLVCEHLEPHGLRRAAAGVRATEAEAAGRRPVRRRRASGRCPRCRARSASSRRSTARRSRDIIKVLEPPASQRAYRRFGRRASRATAPPTTSPARSKAIAQRAGRRRRHRRPRRRIDRGSLGVQRGSRWRARSPRAPCRSFPRSATRST